MCGYMLWWASFDSPDFCCWVWGGSAWGRFLRHALIQAEVI